MAISTRTADSGANAFSLARLLVPTGEMPIAERFAAIQASRRRGRGSRPAAPRSQTLAAVAAALPTSLVTRLARQQAQTSTSPPRTSSGSPVPVYIAGAQLLENYPIGPLAGVAFNLTLLSYLGSLDMGLNIDAAAVAEPERLAADLRAGVQGPRTRLTRAGASDDLDGRARRPAR